VGGRYESPGPPADEAGSGRRPPNRRSVRALSAGLALPRPRWRVAPRRPWRLALVLAVVGAALGGGWAWLRDSSLVAVEHVRIEGALGPEAPAIRAALDRAAREMTTLHVRRGPLETAVANFPRVHHIEVTAHPPHRLTVTVVSERPAAWIGGSGQRIAMTAEGKVLRAGVARTALPVIAVPRGAGGTQVRDRRTLGALAAAGAVPAALRARVTRIGWTGARGLVATLRDGPDVVLGGLDRPRAKWLAAARVLADATSSGARYVDVTVPERPAAGGVVVPEQIQPASAPTPTPPSVPGVGTPACGTACPTTP
jgi:cell division protein FtsQ